ncbi:phosphotransferase [Geodermatophilus chilensis]|uniref:phosphotransferase n=1 Tax=Geodermatophilus chilensis TaxID=2035835 RepID=UPI0018E43E18|nr:phosphotransferase [Geodermatophilus chilensis]
MSDRAVRAEDAFDVPAVAVWLAAHADPERAGVDLSAVPEVRQFSGGVSNLTYLMRYPDGQLVLRRPPRGAHHGGAHDMGREYRIQTELGRVLPYVPRTVALCEDSDVIGTPFSVMQRLEGPIPRRDLPPGVELSREQVAQLCRNVVDLLIGLHSVDLESTGLADLGRGPGFVRRQVDSWTERYRRARTRHVGPFERVMRWLADNQPADRRHTLVHNDFRFDNVVLDPADLTRPVGLLDWELATVGDPLMDLANALGYWVQPDDGPLLQLFRRQPTHLPGMMTREQVVAYYCARTGTRVTHREWAWYQVFGLFRVAVIAQQVYARHLAGQTTNRQFRLFGVAVVALERRCRRLIAAAERMSEDRAAAQVGSPLLTRRRLSTRRWTPPAGGTDAGPTGPFRVARRLATGGHGPEDVAFDDQGRVVAGLRDGWVVRIDPATGARTVVDDTGGRPLGLEPCPDGSVLVCDHDRGLLRVQPDGAVEVLADTVDGEPLTFASNVVAHPDGTIWFTTSTSRWDLEHHLGDLFEHSRTGRLVRRDPDGTVTPVLSGLAFANGLALAPDGSSLLFAETAAYRVSRYWLTGPRAGSTEPLVEDLPGFPDNLSLGSDGLLWIGMAAPRNALLDRLLPLPGVLRQLLWNLPARLRPAAEPLAWVLAVDLDGRAVHDLRTTDGSYRFVTAAAERDGTVVAASLHEDDVVVLEPPG